MTDPLPAFIGQFLWFSLAWAALARFAVWPATRAMTRSDALSVWIAPQMFRVLGVGLLVPALSPEMPLEFATRTAVADSITAILGLAAFIALRGGWPEYIGVGLAWACTVFGIGDLGLAVYDATRLGLADHLAAQWYVPALVVPLMSVAHVGALLALLRVDWD